MKFIYSYVYYEINYITSKTRLDLFKLSSIRSETDPDHMIGIFLNIGSHPIRMRAILINTTFIVVKFIYELKKSLLHARCEI